jgi:hypothetical protein
MECSYELPMFPLTIVLFVITKPIPVMISCVKNLRFFVAGIFLMALAISPAIAQKNDPPSGQFGAGIYALSTSTPSGLEGIYAFSQNVQVGTELSLGITSSSGVSITNVVFEPFFRYLFTSTVSPYVQGGFTIVSTSGSSFPGTNTTTTGIFIGAGVAYYLNHNIGINGGVDVLNLSFSSPSTTIVGFGIVRVGADWFF